MNTAQRTPILFALTLAACSGGVASSTVSVGSASTAERSSVIMEPRAPGRVLVRDADLTYSYDGDDEKKALRTRLIDFANQSGGYVASEDEGGLVLRVPSDSLEAFLDGAEKLGEVTDKSVRVEEVTAQHTDLSIRIDNAKRMRERLQALLAEAKTVEEMLNVEKELGRVTQELELYEGQMRNLEKRIALSAVNVRFEQDVQPGPVGWVFYGVYQGVKWLFIWD